MSNDLNLAATSPDAIDLLNRIGQLTRQLREGLRELGLDRQVAMAAEAIPDARDRLGYIATMTERAAERALNAIDLAQPMQEQLAQDAKALNARWTQWSEHPVQLDGAHELVTATRTYLGQVPVAARAINGQLMEIMMAQDFQDLTGQVIKKMVTVINEVESQLIKVLVDHSQPAVTQESGLQNGPQVKPGQPVASQAQVDDLLESLGF